MQREAARPHLAAPSTNGRVSQFDASIVDDHAFPLTDVGNALRLVALHGHDLRYVPELGWHAWDGRRWQLDRDGEPLRRMTATVRTLTEQALDVPEERRRKKLLAHALKSQSHARLVAALRIAEVDPRIVARIDRFDADPWILNVANGTVWLEVGELTDHQRGDLQTKLAPAAFDPTATAPTWSAFLERVFAADNELIGFVQRAVGYSLTGSTSEQCLFILYGTGANGKTTFIEVLRAVLGDYGQQAPAESFLERRGDQIPNDLARLPGARFVAAAETGEGRRLAETLVKRLTGGDTITARHLYRDYFEFTPTFKAWLATNHKPEIRGTDTAIWRRIRLIPFAVTIPEDERDPQLRDKLAAELPGILNWAIDGCRHWQERGLDTPTAVARATADYRNEMDVIGAFIDECCDVGDDLRVKAGALYTRYGYWAQSVGERDPLTQKALGLRLAERGFARARDREGRWYTGLDIHHDGEA